MATERPHVTLLTKTPTRLHRRTDEGRDGRKDRTIDTGTVANTKEAGQKCDVTAYGQLSASTEVFDAWLR